MKQFPASPVVHTWELLISVVSRWHWSSPNSSQGTKCCSGGSSLLRPGIQSCIWAVTKCMSKRLFCYSLGFKSLCANLFDITEGLLVLQWALNLTPDVSLQCLSFVGWHVSMKQCWANLWRIYWMCKFAQWSCSVQSSMTLGICWNTPQYVPDTFLFGPVYAVCVCLVGTVSSAVFF